MAKRKATLPAAAPADTRGLTVARWALLAMTFLVPLAMSNWTWLGFGAPFTANQFDLVKLVTMLACLLVGYGGWTVYLMRGPADVRWSPVYWLTLAAAALTVLSALLAPDVSAAILGRDPRYAGVVMLLAFLAAFYLASQCIDSEAERRRLGLALVASATLVALYAVLQHFGLDPIDWGAQLFDTTRSSSTFGNPLPLGGFLVASISVSLALAFAERDTRLKVAEWASISVQVAALVATFSRGAWLGMFVALAVLMLAGWRRGVRPSRVDTIGLLVAIGVVAALVVSTLGSANVDTNAAARLASSVNVEAGSAGERILVWRTATKAIAERPLQGWGPEGFRWAYARLRPTEVIKLNGPIALADDTHDYPLNLAVTLGVPAALATLALLLWVAVLGWLRLWGRGDGEGEGIPLSAGYLAGLLGMLAYLLTGLSASPSVLFVWVLAGALLPTSASRTDTSLLAARIVGVLATILAAIALVFLGSVVRADALFVKGRTSSELDARLRYYEAAAKAALNSDAYAEALGNTYTTAAQQAIQQARAMQAAGQDPTTAVQGAGEFIEKAGSALARAIEIAPEEPSNYLDAGRLYLLSGTNLNEDDLAKAAAYASEGLKRSPLSPRLLSLYARVLVAQKLASEAIAPAEKAVSLYRDADTLAALGEARLANGDRNGAISAFTEAVKLEPDNASLKAELEAARATDR